MNLYAERVSKIDTENAFKVGPYIAEVEKQGHKVIKCNLGEPDFALPKHIREEVKKQIDNDLTHYCDPQGILPLREAIASYISKSRGISVTPDRVVVFPGAKPPIGLCQQTYCNPGDEIIYPSPGFPIYESFIAYIGAKPVPLHLREEAGFSFTGAELEPLITDKTKLIYINFPSNPTGGVATEEQLSEIARVIKKKANPDIRIYSDEVYEHILFDGSVHRSIAPLMPDNTIIISGVSKSYSWTGGRVGWAVFPTAEEAQTFKNLNINYFSCIPAYNQMGAKVAIESPESPAEIRKMVTAFQERRDVVVSGLNSIEGISCQKPKGAFYVFPNIGGVCESIGAVSAYNSLPDEVKAKTSPSTLFQMFLLFKYHVASMDRKSFGKIGTAGKHFLRLSIATGIEDLKNGVERISKAARDRDGFAAFIKEGKRLS
ncbi:MAG TPA: aminotransferase class I/II-fold pyridoxal phosphate-dependent enzyme [bacterium]|nr:aminotransferase class I/II-fold pyridoxal phosphate-dependent enzyme [Myxococcales bacterium]OQA61941.1 MAG: putative N-acetyl-LL-diaminopimelate aminotransferase [bacterium ADurb.Bin270]HPW44877.1 aminotransferase class I/II-fold pyridoxal phosphate-dependent enzyme [bacterium]HQC50216.1 aminotransferase class I/II-fold pyridoxal phosphate-dependent enzyme [bacterium]